MSKIKKLALGAVAMCMVAGLCVGAAGCGSKSTESSSITKAIAREDGSGTRDGFDEKINDGNGNTLKKQSLAACVSKVSSTDAVGSAVSNSYDTIGYMSMGSVSKYSDLQSCSYEGVEATVANVQNGTYSLQRNFNLIYNAESYSSNDLAQNFVSYIESAAGQQIITNEGYVCLSDVTVKSYTAYTGTKTSLSFAGSSSVTPLIQALADEYKKLNSSISIEINTTDSTGGVTSAQGGTCDLGMASRNLKSTETGVEQKTIAIDGITVVVKKGSWLTNVTSLQLYNLYLNGTAIENTSD